MNIGITIVIVIQLLILMITIILESSLRVLSYLMMIMFLNIYTRNHTLREIRMKYLLIQKNIKID